MEKYLTKKLGDYFFSFFFDIFSKKNWENIIAIRFLLRIRSYLHTPIGVLEMFITRAQSINTLKEMI